MPKTNDATGATYDGYQGVVEHAGGAGSTRPGGLSELDPSRNIDGSVVDGFESDEREISEEEPNALGADVTPIAPASEGDEPDRAEDDDSADSEAVTVQGNDEKTETQRRGSRTGARSAK